MAVTLSVCESFLGECLTATHTPNDDYKIALFVRNPASPNLLGKGTTAYATTVNGAAEITGTNYSAGGASLAKDSSAGQADGSTTNVRVNTSSHYAGYDWANLVFSNVTITGLNANGFYALIYNATRANRAVAVAEFAAGDIANDPTAANLTITLPSSGDVVVKLAA